MRTGDSILDQAAMARARGLLATPREPEQVWPALAAAAFAAVAALSLATAMVIAPPVTTRHLPAEDLQP